MNPSGFYVDPNKVLDLISQQTNELRGVEKKSGDSFSTFSSSVPRPAFEILNINRREQILFTTFFSFIYLYINDL